MIFESTDLSAVINAIRPLNAKVLAEARAHTQQLVMPPRALGRLHSIGEQLCAIQGTLNPTIERKAVLIMAGDHGIATESVSAFPQEVTGAMVKIFLAGGAGINAIARQVGADVFVADMGIIPQITPDDLPNGNHLLVHKMGPGTANITKGPAMSRSQARKAIMTGFTLAKELYRSGVQILGTGDMGIGNTTPSAAIGAVICKKSVDLMTGPGTGIDADHLALKKERIRTAIELNLPNAEDGLDVLSKIGGFEIGGIAGIVLAAAYCRKPVMVDGFISTAGALIAHTLCPACADFMIAGHCSEEPGHRAMLSYLGLEPLLDLGMRLGEGTGGTLAMTVVESAIRVITEVMTFEEANVTGKI